MMCVYVCMCVCECICVHVHVCMCMWGLERNGWLGVQMPGGRGALHYPMFLERLKRKHQLP